MQKHTPGPWRRVAFDILGSTAEGNGMVAEVTTDGLSNLAEADANARLIAAAPDMLTALKTGQAMAQVHAATLTIEGKPQDARSWALYAEYAATIIAKAEGN